jgi:hypothetical protein
MAVEQIDQAVIKLRHEQGDAVRAIRPLDTPAHLKAFANDCELVGEVVEAEVEPSEVPLDAHQEQAALGVLVLVRVQDVGVVSIQELGDGGDNPFAVGAVDQQDAGLRHGALP